MVADACRAHVRRRDPPSGTLAELAPRLVDAVRALVPDGRGDHALGADRLTAPRAVHARLDVRVAIAELGNAGRGRRWERRLIHVNGHGTGRGCERRERLRSSCASRARADRRGPSRRRAWERRAGAPLGPVRRCRVRPRRRCAAARRSPARPGAGGPPSVPSPPRRARPRGRLAADASIRRIVGSSMPSSTRRSTIARGGHERDADRHRDEQAHDRIGSREAGQHADRAGHDPERRQAVGSRVLSVRDQGRRSDRLAHADAVDRHGLVAEEPDHPRAEHHPDVIERRRMPQPVDRLDGGEHGRCGDQPHDRQARQVLGAVVAVRVSLVRGTAAKTERDQQRDRREDVGEVVDRVGQQRDGAREDRRRSAASRRSRPGCSSRSTWRGRPARWRSTRSRPSRSAHADVRAAPDGRVGTSGLMGTCRW